MTANFEEKKREKRNRDKENLILLRVDRRIEKRKKKEKGESLEKERGTFELALFVSSPLFIKSLGNASRYENVCNFSFLLRVFNGLLTYELFPRRRPALHETAPVFFSPLPLPLEKKTRTKVYRFMRKSVAVASRATILPASGTVFESVGASNDNRFSPISFLLFSPRGSRRYDTTNCPIVTIRPFILIQFTAATHDIYLFLVKMIFSTLVHAQLFICKIFRRRSRRRPKIPRR